MRADLESEVRPNDDTLREVLYFFLKTNDTTDHIPAFFVRKAK